MSKLILFFALAAFVFYFLFRSQTPNSQVEKPQFGLFYSAENARFWGLDPQKAYLDLLKEPEISWVTLPFYWRHSLDNNGNLRIEELLWQAQEAQKKGKEVIITLGVKAPGHPEFFFPEIYQKTLPKGSRLSQSQELREEFFPLLKTVVNQLKEFDNLKAWQLENEPFWNLKSTANWVVDQDFLKEEVKIIRREDQKKRPLLLNHPATSFWDNDWEKTLAFLEEGDYLGVNIHTKTQTSVVTVLNFWGKALAIPWPKLINVPVYSFGPLSPNLKKYQKAAQEKKLKLIVTELQAEPYSPLPQKTQKLVLFPFLPEDIERGVELAQKAGFSEITFWGAPFWLSQKNSGKIAWWETVVKILKSSAKKKPG